MADPEVQAVETALNTLALAESEKALQKVVTRLLPAILSALSTKSTAARAKCIEALKHINLRVRATPSIKLPFDEVLSVCTDTNAAILTINVGIQGGYLTRCFDRLTVEEQSTKFSSLARSAALVTTEKNRDSLHFLCLRSLTSLYNVNIRSKSNKQYDFNDHKLWNVVQSTCSDYAIQLFFEYCLRALRMKLTNNVSEDSMIAIIHIVSEYAGGMNDNQQQQNHHAAKIYPHLLIAAGMSTRSAVQSIGEQALKKIDGADMLINEDPSLTDKLFELFTDPLTEISQRIIILSKALLNIPLCASCFPEVLQVIHLSVHTTGIPSRFQSLGMQFVSFVIKHCELNILKENFKKLVDDMLKIANNITDGSHSFPDTLRGFGFTALGELILRLPQIMNDLPEHQQDTNDIKDNRITAEFFFSAAQASTLPVSVRSSASHTLIAIARVLNFDQASKNAQQSVFRTLIGALENVNESAASSRAAAVYWANECFGFTNPNARLINIIAAADTKQDVRQNALAGLSPRRWSLKIEKEEKKKENEEKIDSDEIMQDVNMVTDKKKELCSISEMVKVSTEYGIRRHPLMIEAYLTFVFYLIRNSVTKNGKLELANIEEVNMFFENNINERKSLEKLCGLADDVLFGGVNTTVEGGTGMSTSSNLEKAAMSVCVFASKLKVLWNECASRYAKRIDELISIASRKIAIGDMIGAKAIAGLIGCAASHTQHGMTDDQLKQLVEQISSMLAPNDSGNASGREGEDKRAAYILCLGQIIVLSRRHNRLSIFDSSSTSPLSLACVSLTRRILAAVESSNAVRMAACSALTDIGASGILPVPLVTREILTGSLSGLLKAHSTNPKLVQFAADALGKLCIGEPRKDFRKTGTEILLQLCKERKEDEIRFVAAESLVRCASGFDAPSPTALEQVEGDSSGSSSKKNNKKDAKGGSGNSGGDGGPDDETIAETLQGALQMRIEPFEVKQVVNEDGKTVAGNEENEGLKAAIKGAISLAYDERPTARAGGCVCLVTFLRLLGRKHQNDADDNVDNGFKMKFRTDEDENRFKDKQACVHNLLEDMQRAFTTLLGDRSEFVQQLASCGVALAYEMCPPDQQNELVGALVRSLTAGKSKSAAIVPGDQGTLLELGQNDVKDDASSVPKTGTYKELCTLAQDMGQPDLVYKFMDLAGHAALWNNRKGAALAGSALLGGEVAARQLKPHVKKLLPRLYVYCYDPTESVRTAMASVLSAVIKASGLGSVYEAVTVHFDDVMAHCLKSMTSRQWRSREAGCGAVRDALASSRTWEQVKEHIEDFWYYTLRAMDDIKETVRKAASGTARALSELSIHLCDSSQVGVGVAREASEIVIKAVMQGIMHADQSVRALCTGTMTKLIRYGGEALRPSVPKLIGMLLEAATEMDDAPQLNYVGFHISEEERQALDDARVNIASSSTASQLVDSLERLTSLVDETNVEDAVRQVTRMSKVGVGIPTRAATARVFGSLLKGRASIVKQFASKMMTAAGNACAMEAGGSAALRVAWSRAAGSAARLCEVDSVSKFVKSVAELAGSDDERERAQASYLAVGLWRESAETARQHAGALLPLAYMGAHEVDDSEVSESEMNNSDLSSSTNSSVVIAVKKNWKEVWEEGSGSEDAALRYYAKEITDICEKRLQESGQYRVKRSAAKALGAVAGAWREGSSTEFVERGAASLVGVLTGHVWEGKIAVLEAVKTMAKRCGGLPVVWGKVSGVKNVIGLLIGESKRGKSEYRVAAIEAIKELIGGCQDWISPNEGVALFEEIYEGMLEYWKVFITTIPENNSPSAMEIDMNADVNNAVWETGSDANAVDARNKMRKAKRMLCVHAVKCLESAAAANLCGHGQADAETPLDRMLKLVECIVKSDWEVRLVALETLKGIARKWTWDSKRDAAMGRRMMTVINVGIEDTKYAIVRKVAMECILNVNGGSWLEDDENNMKSAVLKCSRDDVDHMAQMAAKKVVNTLQL